jgi:hypothetical protein
VCVCVCVCVSTVSVAQTLVFLQENYEQLETCGHGLLIIINSVIPSNVISLSNTRL